MQIGKQSSVQPSGLVKPAALKDVLIEVTNIPNGVVVKMTSTKPEVAQALQARFMDYAKTPAEGVRLTLVGYSPTGARTGVLEVNGKLHCNHAEGSEECLKKHASGECQGHEPGSKHGAQK
jgi:hypothetical protein